MKRTFLIFSTIILFSVGGNCQWYYKKYGVKDMNQLTQEQLNERLRLNKQLLVLDPVIMVVGTTFIIAGIHFINKANAEEISLEGAFNFPREKILGTVFLSSGVVCDICGFLLLPLSLTEINKIKKIQKNREIKLGLISCPPNIMFNHSDISLIPGISLSILF
jgi:hypothetical protein